MRKRLFDSLFSFCAIRSTSAKANRSSQSTWGSLRTKEQVNNSSNNSSKKKQQ